MAQYWGGDRSGLEFIMFSGAHLSAVFLAIVFWVFMFVFRDAISKSTMKKVWLYGIVTILIVCEISLYIWNTINSNWSILYSLPLQLCSISLIMSIFMLLSRSYALYEFLYFAGMGGAIMALVTPELRFTFPHFIFFHFFIGHAAIITACLYMTFIMKYRPTLKSVMRTMLWLNILLIPIFIVNAITGANYMFLMRKPSTASLFDFLGPWPWYIIGLELMAFITFLIMYIPFVFAKKKSH